MKTAANFLHLLVIFVGLTLSPNLRAERLILDQPALTVTGQISTQGNQEAITFDMSSLAELPQHSFTTNTPWYEEAHTFTGPLLRDVLTKVGAKGTDIIAIALNGYRSTIPMDDALQYDVILARLVDGEPMRIRNKGPLIILYPFDDNEEIQNPVYYGRCVWQLNALHIE